MIERINVVFNLGYLRNQREFSDGADLNRLFPGKQHGQASTMFVRQIMIKIVSNLDYLIDMHTASFGRVNSFYVRADLTKKIQKEMALLQNAEIVIHNSSPEGSLRGQASLTGVPAITIEIGDPQIFHSKHISSALNGVENILCHLNMYNGCWVLGKVS
mmetsp:Transcript_2001/g.3667  ORF Transcript_2001/g.3667 Transcript_2001/m.3667 type:complete len:159 (-) Transcript_2001:544-1020(-)